MKNIYRRILLSVFSNVIELSYEEYTNLFDIYIYVMKYHPDFSRHDAIIASKHVFCTLFNNGIIELFEDFRFSKDRKSKAVVRVQKPNVQGVVDKFSWDAPSQFQNMTLVISITSSGKIDYEQDLWRDKVRVHPGNA